MATPEQKVHRPHTAVGRLRLLAVFGVLITVGLLVSELHVRGPRHLQLTSLISRDVWKLEPISQTFMISINHARLPEQRKRFAASGLTFISTLDDLHFPVRPTTEFLQNGAIDTHSGLLSVVPPLANGQPDWKSIDRKSKDTGCLFSHMMLWRHILLLDDVSMDEWFVVLEDDAALRFDPSQHGESERSLKQLLAKDGAEMIWLTQRVYTNLAGAVIGSGTEGYAVKRSAIAHLIDVMTPAAAPVDMQLLAWTQGTTWSTKRNRGRHLKTPIRGFASPRPFVTHDSTLREKSSLDE